VTKTPAYKTSHGLLMPSSFPTQAMASALTYRSGQGDVFVATYPKCGTTWTQNILLLLANGGIPLPPGESLDDVFPHIELTGGDYVAAMPSPRLIKTHLPLAMTPWSEDARYVCVARNPFDCAVSFYHHTRGFPQHYDFEDGQFDDYFECFVSGKVDFGDYFDHLAAWFDRRNASNVHFVTYEELKADTPGQIRRMANFLGDPFARHASDENILNAVLEHSSFRRMRKNQRRWASSRADSAPAFVRKGVVGDWANLFSPMQARRLLDRCETRFAGTGMAKLWPAILASAEAHASRASAGSGDPHRS
jgi:hypothetical protein